MKILSTKWFKKWSSKKKLDTQDLLQAIEDLEQSLSLSALGQHLFKIRVKRKGGGKRGGFRTLIIYKKNDRAIFLYGFGKNEKSNITKTELIYFQKLGNDLLALNDNQIQQSLIDLIKVKK